MINVTSDLQKGLLGRRQNARLNSDMLRLTQEISSGKKSDIHQSLSGNIAPLASISKTIRMLDSYDIVANNLDLKFEYAATAIDQISGNLSGLGAKVLSAASSNPSSINQVLEDEKNRFRDAVQALQVRAGDQFVFSGENSNVPPLLDAEQILVELRTATAGITDADVFFDTVDRWFNEPGNGFDVTGYLGGSALTERLSVSSTSKVGSSFTADSPAIRGALRDLALIVLAEEGTFAGDTNDLSRLYGESLLSSADALTREQAAIGAAQNELRSAKTQNSSERFSLGAAYNQITGVDLFEAASRLEEAQSQLESLYLLTARTSRLSLTEYLR